MKFLNSFLLALLLCPPLLQARDEVKQWHHNEEWLSPSKDASESMPLGGGDIACNVWVEKGDLMIYIQRSGAFSEIGEFLKLGRLRLSLSNNPFEGADSFTQVQHLAEGNMSVTSVKDGVETKVLIWVDVFNHSLHIKTESSQEVKAKLLYENWRFEDIDFKDNLSTRRFFGCFQFEASPYKMTKYKDDVSYHEGGILFYHRNKEYTESPLLMIEVQDLKEHEKEIPNYNQFRTSGGFIWGDGFVPSAQGSGIYQKTPFCSWSLESSSARCSHHLMMATHIAQTDSLAMWQAQLDDQVLADKKELGQAEKNEAWWNQFWNRSYIIVDAQQKSKDVRYHRMGRNYQLFRYQLGMNLYGEYPTRFNGGSLTYDPVLVDANRPHDPDWRAWGGDVFTQQNQRLVYWPLLKSGDFEGLKPEFDMYRHSLQGALVKTKAYFDHAGAMFTEYLHSSGMDITIGWGWDASLPTHLGARLRNEANIIPFGDPRLNDPETKGSNINRFIEYGMLGGAGSFHWMGQIEHSYMALEMRRFSGADIAEYMPFIKESMIFFFEHYKCRQQMRNKQNYGEDGKLVLYPSTGCECYKGAKDPADVIAGLQAVLCGLLAEENRHYLNDEERAYYEEFLARLPELPYGEVKGDKIMLAAEFSATSSPDECPQFYPLFPFNRCDLTQEGIDVYRNTWKHGTFWKDVIVSWHQDGIFYARMGLVDKASAYNRRKLDNSPRRFPTYWGPGMDWVPDHNWGGSGMIALQEMVLQTIGDKILVLPCWPDDVDVSFKLHAPQQTTVEVEYKDGAVSKMEVLPASRLKDVILFKSTLGDLQK